MSLFVVATPIGHPEDITLRAIRCLQEADLVIGEERKEVSKLLKSLQLTKPIETLNEHSREADFDFLTDKCAHHNVALVSDAGTPGFCDPGAELVHRCRRRQIPVTPIPGASSLTALISVSGFRLNQFVFVGFLPAKQEFRDKALQKLKSEKRACVVMDTPYRLSKMLNELKSLFPERRAVLAMDLTLPSENILDSELKNLAAKFADHKAEFILLLYPYEF